MKWSTVVPLAISVISLLPSAGAWEVTWKDASNEEHSRTGHGPSKCIEIDNPKGNVFKIDAQGEQGINMLLFPNDECKGKEVGSATEDFSKESSRDLRGFKVVSLSATSSGNTTTKGSTSRGAVTSTKAPSTRTKSVSSVHRAQSTTTQTTAATSSAGTKTSGHSSTTAPSTSTSPATTSNAAVQMGVSNGNMGMGLMGGVIGFAFMQWMI